MPTERRDGAISAERRAEIAARLMAVTVGPLTLSRYYHGGGRLVVEEGDDRTLVGDFYHEGDREFYSRARQDIGDLLAALEQTERERDLFAETARRLTAERDAAVAERNEMLAAVVVAHSDLIRYGTHDDNCPKTPRLVQGVVVYGEALEPRACECGLDGGIMAAQDAFSAPDAAARAAARPEGRTGE